MADITPTTVPSKRLAASINAASLTLQLNNILGWDAAALTASDFGTVLYAVLRNDANTVMEIIELDPTTIASASITINKRGLKFTGDIATEVTANKLTWVKNSTIVELGSNPPQLLRHNVNTLADQTVAGVKTFSSAPKSSVDATALDELIRKSQLDAAVLGSLTLTPVVVPGTAGATLLIDQYVYLNVADGEWYLADSDTAATVENVITGITRGGGTDGGAITDGVTIFGAHDAASAIFTANTKYFASSTAGGFSTSAGTFDVSAGFAITTTRFYLYPRFDQMLTENQQDLLVQSELGIDFYAADAGANDTYVITLAPVPTAYTDGMRVYFKANTVNTGACTINVNGLGAKDIRKDKDTVLADGDIKAGQLVGLEYDGTNFQMMSPIGNSLQTVVEEFTATGTWTKPTGAQSIHVMVLAAGGGGGSGERRAAGSLRLGGGGGGGGEYATGIFDADDLPATVTVTIGAFGAGTVKPADTNNGANGGNAVDSSFGNWLFADGGGGGGGGGSDTGGTTFGGNGGGSVGSVTDGDGISRQRVEGGTATQRSGYSAEYGGGGGAGNADGNVGEGGGSVYAAGGGGSGSDIDAGNTVGTSSAGGQSGTYQAGGGGASDGQAGDTNAAAQKGWGGEGGGGGLSTSNKSGGGGGFPGGGGGGATATVNGDGDTATGGDGAGGVIRVTTYF